MCCEGSMPEYENQSDKRGVVDTYQVFPTVLLPFCSARRRYCAALNCNTHKKHQPHDLLLCLFMPNRW